MRRVGRPGQVTVGLRQREFDTLVSFVFNVGSGAFERSALRRRLNLGYKKRVPKELKKYVHAGGKRIEGLVARRRGEVKIWKYGVYNRSWDD